jgi:hypothetical protein
VTMRSAAGCAGDAEQEAAMADATTTATNELAVRSSGLSIGAYTRVSVS